MDIATADMADHTENCETGSRTVNSSQQMGKNSDGTRNPGDATGSVTSLSGRNSLDGTFFASDLPIDVVEESFMRLRSVIHYHPPILSTGSFSDGGYNRHVDIPLLNDSHIGPPLQAEPHFYQPHRQDIHRQIADNDLYTHPAGPTASPAPSLLHISSVANTLDIHYDGPHRPPSVPVSARTHSPIHMESQRVNIAQVAYWTVPPQRPGSPLSYGRADMTVQDNSVRDYYGTTPSPGISQSPISYGKVDGPPRAPSDSFMETVQNSRPFSQSPLSYGRVDGLQGPPSAPVSQSFPTHGGPPEGVASSARRSTIESLNRAHIWSRMNSAETASALNTSHIPETRFVAHDPFRRKKLRSRSRQNSRSLSFQTDARDKTPVPISHYDAHSPSPTIPHHTNLVNDTPPRRPGSATHPSTYNYNSNPSQIYRTPEEHDFPYSPDTRTVVTTSSQSNNGVTDKLEDCINSQPDMENQPELTSFSLRRRMPWLKLQTRKVAPRLRAFFDELTWRPQSTDDLSTKSDDGTVVSDGKFHLVYQIINFATFNIFTSLYLAALLFLPQFYFSRIAKLFEEAQLAMLEIEEFAIQTTWQGENYLDPLGPRGPVVPPEWKRLKNTWEHLIDALVKEWQTLNVISALLIAGILTLIQIEDAGNDFLTRYTALISLICSLMSLLFGCMYIIRFSPMRNTYKAAEWANEVCDEKTSTWWNVYIMLALPAVWISWSIIIYIICIMSYIWRASPNSPNNPPTISDITILKIRIGISILLSLGIMYSVLVLATFRRYGTAMDDKWRERVQKWRNKSEGKYEHLSHNLPSPHFTPSVDTHSHHNKAPTSTKTKKKPTPLPSAMKQPNSTSSEHTLPNRHVTFRMPSPTINLSNRPTNSPSHVTSSEGLLSANNTFHSYYPQPMPLEEHYHSGYPTVDATSFYLSQGENTSGAHSSNSSKTALEPGVQNDLDSEEIASMDIPASSPYARLQSQTATVSPNSISIHVQPPTRSPSLISDLNFSPQLLNYSTTPNPPLSSENSPADDLKDYNVLSQNDPSDSSGYQYRQSHFSFEDLQASQTGSREPGYSNRSQKIIDSYSEINMKPGTEVSEGYSSSASPGSSQRKGTGKARAEDGRLSPTSTLGSLYESEAGQVSHEIDGENTYPASGQDSSSSAAGNKDVEEWIAKAHESLHEFGAFIGIGGASMPKGYLVREDPELAPAPNALGRRLESAQHQIPTILNKGIVTPQEVEILFKIYFENMNLSVSLLDPVLYTVQKTFYRSPFLFTVICAIASRFYSPRPDLYAKIMQQAQNAAGMALISGNKNVEICQAYILLSLYPVPTRKWEDQRSWLYLGLAIRTATDLNLHLPTTGKPLNENHAREMLNRTRVWMNCLNLDRSTGSQYGKPPIISPQDYIANHSDRWWATSPYNLKGFDIHISAYNSELKVMTAFIAKIYSDPDHPTGLNRDVDFEGIATETDNQLKALEGEWFWYLEQTDMSDPQNCFRTGLLRLAFSYSRLVVLSYGFQHAFEKTDGVDENPFLMRCLKAAADVVHSVVNDICRDGQLHYFRHGPDAQSVSVTFASAFLVKLLQPKFASHLTPETRVEIRTMVQSVIDLLGSPGVAIDKRHGPKLYSRFLAKLLAKPRARINPLSPVSTNAPSTYPPMRSPPLHAPAFDSSTVQIPDENTNSLSPPPTEAALSFSEFAPVGPIDPFAIDTAATVAATNESANQINDMMMEGFFQSSLPFDEHIVQSLPSLTDPSGWQDILMPRFNWMTQS